MKIEKILVIVHPGSACGSADFALGSQLAAARRDNLIRDISGWQNGVVVIDGFLSDELAWFSFAPLGEAIAQALAQAQSAGKIADRVWGCDNISPHMPAAIRKLVTRHRLSGDRFAVQVTGAWRGRKGHSACVDLAAEEFRRRGVPATLRRSAVRE